MKKSLKSHFTLAELESFLITFASFLALDLAGNQAVLGVWNGNLSRDALMALGVAVARSFVKFVYISVKNYKK